MIAQLSAPFPYFGGKRTVAAAVWERLGTDAQNYIEPFAGSLAVLLARPGGAAKWETVNDLDGHLTNFWRAVRADPEAVAQHADYPCSEIDLHARHLRLIQACGELTAKLQADPDWYDAKAAGWWVWGACLWIGGGWCADSSVTKGGRTEARIPRLTDRAGFASVATTVQKVPRLTHRVGFASVSATQYARRALDDPHGNILTWFERIADRLRNVRICCGDFRRVLKPSITENMGASVVTAVFLDPPYSHSVGRANSIYAMESDVSDAAREWAIAHGDNPLYRIALAGYEGEHDMPAGWECYEWKTRGGYAGQGGADTAGKANRHRERIWFSPHCLLPLQAGLFDYGEPPECST